MEHSDLEVAYNQPAHSNLEVHKTRDEQDTYKEANYSEQHTYYGASPTAAAAATICGIPRKKFLIIAAIATIVILAAAIGGGVGGSLANNNNKKSTTAVAASSSATAGADSTSQQPASITPSPTTPTPTIVTTSTAYASTTLYPDCPSSNNTVYKAANSDSFLFRKICANSYLNADNGFSSVNEQSKSLDDCINLCVSYNVKAQANISSGTMPVCNSVCWRATIQNDDFPGQCFGFRTSNSSAEFVLGGDDRCDSAAWINS